VDDRRNDTLATFYKKVLKVENTNKLDLSGLGLRFFPMEITVMTNLLHLNLSNNNIKEIPYGIIRLVDLETCDLRRNKLEILPDLSKFEGLAELYLQYNSLDHLHPSLGALTDLEFLVI
jgi:Leucine-rich repeat (LRR) protein